MNTVSSTTLWKTPVEKSVENVENSELSTGISLLSFSAPSCGKVCIPLCIFPRAAEKTICYVTEGPGGLSDKTSKKSLQIVKMRCHFLFPFHAAKKFFVKNAKVSSPVSSAISGEYLIQAAYCCRFINNIRGYTCREK